MKSSDDGWRPPSYDPPPDPRAEMYTRDEAFRRALVENRPYATCAIIAVCIFVYLGQRTLGDILVQAGANNGVAVGQGQIWRLVSCMFLHGSPLHIASNMYVLWSIGSFLERLIGWARFTFIYAVAGITGSLAGALIHPQVVSVGASGAIWGLMGAALGLALVPHRILPPWRAQSIRGSLWKTLLLNAVISFVPGIDATAHFGGGAAGFLLLVTGLATAGARPGYDGEVESGASRAVWVVLGAASALVLLAGIGTAVGLVLLAHD